MAKKKIKDIVADILGDFLDENGYELYNVEFVKESKDWFLRVYIDRSNGHGSDFIGTEDCEKVSRYLSEKLDEKDPIEQNYYLEVSSPGMDRELFTPEHYKKYAGRPVDVKLYRAIDGNKELSGILTGIENDEILIEDSEGRVIKLPINQVAKTKLAVII
ncbi:MAG: ribosome maturation factor RimP [Eubacteriaceae bacterium]|nr:ribosome maturation factor RimP [Eubacteriaceae bacterium]